MKKALIILPVILTCFALTNPVLPLLPADPTSQDGKIIKAEQFPTRNYQINTIVIDPGHGGHDPGCSGAHSKEKHLALAIAKYFAQAVELNYPEVKVLLTRKTDVFIPLNVRAQIATENNADLFVSIHCNYMPGSAATHGSETFVLGLHATEANLEVAKRENASILYEEGYKETYGYDPNSPEAHIMMSMFQNAFLEQSINFASKVQKYIHSEANRKDRGVKQAGFLVLRYATMPSVLIETGFLSNRTEEDYLSSEAGQLQVANALLFAFRDYKNEMEGKTFRNLQALTASNLKPDSGSAALMTGVGTSAKEFGESNSNPRTEPVKPGGQKEKPNEGNNGVSEKEKILSPKISPRQPVEKGTVSSSPSKPQTSNIQYRVQLAASQKLLDVTTGKWAKLEYLIEVVTEYGLYKYQVRNFATQNEADAAKQKLRAIGFSDAFTVGYQNGIRVYPPKAK